MTRDATTHEEKSSRSYWGFLVWPVMVVVLYVLSVGPANLSFYIRGGVGGSIGVIACCRVYSLISEEGMECLWDRLSNHRAREGISCFVKKWLTPARISSQRVGAYGRPTYVHSTRQSFNSTSELEEFKEGASRENAKASPAPIASPP